MCLLPPLDNFMFVTKAGTRSARTPRRWDSEALKPTLFQAHYAVQARRSRSITRKRKREDSVLPASVTRSHSCSRPPRDVSGLRDVKVSSCNE